MPMPGNIATTATGQPAFGTQNAGLAGVRPGQFGPAPYRDSGIGVLPSSRLAGLGATEPPKKPAGASQETVGQTYTKIGQSEQDKIMSKDPKMLDLKQKAQSGQVYVKGEPQDLTWAGPALTSLSAMAVNIPPPYGIIISVIMAKAAEGAEAVRGLFKVAATAAIKHLPVNVAEKVLAGLEAAPTDLKTDAAKDKYVQWNAEQIAPTRLSNKALMTGAAKLDDNVSWRFADKIYSLCMSSGAQPWQAATVAFGVTMACKPKDGSAAVTAHAEMYLKQVYAASGLPYSWQKGVGPAWAACVQKQGGIIVDAATANALFSQNASGSSSGGGGGGLVVAAALAAAAKLLFF